MACPLLDINKLSLSDCINDIVSDLEKDTFRSNLWRETLAQVTVLKVFLVQLDQLPLREAFLGNFHVWASFSSAMRIEYGPYHGDCSKPAQPNEMSSNVTNN